MGGALGAKGGFAGAEWPSEACRLASITNLYAIVLSFFLARQTCGTKPTRSATPTFPDLRDRPLIRFLTVSQSAIHGLDASGLEKDTRSSGQSRARGPLFMWDLSLPTPLPWHQARAFFMKSFAVPF